MNKSFSCGRTYLSTNLLDLTTIQHLGQCGRVAIQNMSPCISVNADRQINNIGEMSSLDNWII